MHIQYYIINKHVFLYDFFYNLRTYRSCRSFLPLFPESHHMKNTGLALTTYTA